MTEHELRTWRARLKVGDRVGWHFFECLYPATLGRLSLASRPGSRCWQLIVDADPESYHDEAWDVLCGEEVLEPLPDPEPKGTTWVGLARDWPAPIGRTHGRTRSRATKTRRV